MGSRLQVSTEQRKYEIIPRNIGALYTVLTCNNDEEGENAEGFANDTHRMLQTSPQRHSFDGILSIRTAFAGSLPRGPSKTRMISLSKGLMSIRRSPPAPKVNRTDVRAGARVDPFPRQRSPVGDSENYQERGDDLCVIMVNKHTKIARCRRT
jgi:hypothetical protein